MKNEKLTVYIHPVSTKYFDYGDFLSEKKSVTISFDGDPRHTQREWGGQSPDDIRAKLANEAENALLYVLVVKGRLDDAVARARSFACRAPVEVEDDEDIARAPTVTSGPMELVRV